MQICENISQTIHISGAKLDKIDQKITRGSRIVGHANILYDLYNDVLNTKGYSKLHKRITDAIIDDNGRKEFENYTRGTLGTSIGILFDN